MTKINGVGPDAEMTTHPNGGMETIPIGRFDLLPPRALIKIAALFMEKSTSVKGPRKYPKNNWRLIPRRAHINHALGHLFAFIAGDDSDDHLTHATSRLMMAMETKDDRPYDEVHASESVPGKLIPGEWVEGRFVPNNPFDDYGIG